MTESLPAAFATTLTGEAPPATWPAPLAALWWLARRPGGPGSEGWERAHALVQDAAGPEAAWVHAHLHRIEGDAGNARYWYGRAGRAEALGSTADERATLIAVLADPIWSCRPGGIESGSRRSRVRPDGGLRAADDSCRPAQ